MVASSITYQTWESYYNVLPFKLFVICLFIVRSVSAVDVAKLSLSKLFGIHSLKCRLKKFLFMEVNLDFKLLYIQDYSFWNKFLHLF